ncbi:class I SAM-dependent methyltransferase [Paracoccus benzoatiresistens]|uniref:Class I SAM-dependent methyltransferase n=1 Tax=Paracoccus benzoatiresistens TaxID=2997341 RepID=A0ABT4J2B4_9RHOB|nr:class I SAM-dependent methyltransferase [Paracoccus sp. EF6]MCZ0960566.1 class I SAM-dependent methyltransferase [Paracoccus sp. EF6]
MAQQSRHDAWQAGPSYDRYMGRWSARIAPLFLDWLEAEKGLDWLEIGCGTGALSAAIMARAGPASLVGIDPSAGFLERAREIVPDPRARFLIGDAQALPVPAASADVAVAGLVLNFVSDRPLALAQMMRVVRPGGTIGFYVWDYPGGGMGFMRAFWTEAAALDPAATDLTEDRRFPFCTLPQLIALTAGAGLHDVEGTGIEIATTFRDFDDYWQPFTLGAGPAPGYCASLESDARQRLRDRLARSLPRDTDGSITLPARAWAVRGRVPRSCG